MRARLRGADTTVLSLTLAALAYSTMQMMVVPALPAIQHDLSASADDSAWLISAFLASTAVATPIAGRLGDLYGKERMLVAVLGVFTLGGVVGVVAGSVELLIVARVLQGVGGAVFPLAYGLSRDVLAPERVPVAIGLIAGSFGVGGSIGLVLSGLLVDHLAWEATFAVGAVAGIAAIAGVIAFVPAGARKERVRIDVAGGVVLAIGLVLLLVGIGDHTAAWTDPLRLGLTLGGLAVLAVWAAWEARQELPLVDVRLLARADVWPVNAVGAAIGFGMYATGFLIPQLVQADPATGIGFDASVTTTSLYLLPALVSGLATGWVSGLLGRRYGSPLPLVLGVVLMAVGYVVLVAGLHAPAAVAIGTLITHGIGLNLGIGAMANLIVQAAPASRTSEASGVNATVRTIGGAVGIQIVAAVMVAPSGARGLPSEDGFVEAFLLCTAVMVLALAVYGTRVRRPLAPSESYLP